MLFIMCAYRFNKVLEAVNVKGQGLAYYGERFFRNNEVDKDIQIRCELQWCDM